MNILDVIINELNTKLAVSENPDDGPRDSIMTYKVLCDHDSGFLCEHRRKWILDYVTSLGRVE